jgi:glycosyltransferase involved in cell wall biosynthesis
VHHVALQPTVVGSLAATGLPFARLNAVAGFGFVFTSTTLKARIARPAFRALLRYVLNNRHASVLVQNPDDRAAVKALGITDGRIFIIRGSGVETDKLTPVGEPPDPITIGFVGRLLADKGVRTLVAAHEILARQGRTVRLLIAGDPDPANPASIPLPEIESWRRRPGVEVLGHVTDIAKFWASAHIAVLPSRREGLPKSLLEAAACARPIIATNVPGCREIARENVNALLVPPDDAQALADSIARLADDKKLRHKFGEAGRKLVENEFSANRIGSETVALYDRFLGLTR